MKLLSVSSDTVQLSWWEPARPNGVIHGYRLYFKTKNVTSVHRVGQNSSAMMETLTKLGIT